MKKVLLAGLATGLIMAGTASAEDFDFNGTFLKDNDNLQFNFSVESLSAVTLFSSSWDDGGFDPILAIWTSDGAWIAEQDDGRRSGSVLSNSVNYDYGIWDSYYAVDLGAGDYIVTIGQYENFAISQSLADGFTNDGNPNFTFDNRWGNQTYFNGIWDRNDPRTGAWAFHLLNVNQATVIDPNPAPEPATMLLFGTGLAGLAAVGRRKEKK